MKTLKFFSFSFKGLECPLQVIEIPMTVIKKKKAPTSFTKGKLLIYFSPICSSLLMISESPRK